MASHKSYNEMTLQEITLFKDIMHSDNMGFYFTTESVPEDNVSQHFRDKTKNLVLRQKKDLLMIRHLNKQ